jgi:homeobox protein cut-like
LHVDVNLSELQKQLDTQGLEIVDNQKESVVGRKSLADKTKGEQMMPYVYRAQVINSNVAPEFKKLPEEDKLEALKGLLKGSALRHVFWCLGLLLWQRTRMR